MQVPRKGLLSWSEGMQKRLFAHKTVHGAVKQVRHWVAAVLPQLSLPVLFLQAAAAAEPQAVQTSIYDGIVVTQFTIGIASPSAGVWAAELGEAVHA